MTTTVKRNGVVPASEARARRTVEELAENDMVPPEVEEDVQIALRHVHAALALELIRRHQ